MRTVIITGSAGHLGRALRARFEALGDEVFGIDLKDADREIDLDGPHAEAQLSAQLGSWKIDIVICNAKVRDWHAHNSLAYMARQCIVNVGSIYGVLGNDPSMYEGTEVAPTPAWYAASKGALVALTRWQATNLAPARSNCVCPGGIYRDHSDLFQKRYCEKVPLRRMASEDDIVGPIVWLCSDEARYITGQILMVDGGLSCL